MRAKGKINLRMDRLKRNPKLESELFSKIPEKINAIYRKSINQNKSGYWQTISEMRAFVAFTNIGIEITRINFKTKGGKDVDLLAKYKQNQLFIEVKGSTPIPSEIAKQGRSLDSGIDKMERALRKANPKFLTNKKNILVIADEETIGISLFNNPLLEYNNTPLEFFHNSEYQKISAIVLLGGLYGKQLYSLKTYTNPYCKNPINRDILSLFENQLEI